MKGMSVKVWGIRKPIQVRVNVRNCDSIGVKVAAEEEVGIHMSGGNEAEGHACSFSLG